MAILTDKQIEAMSKGQYIVLISGKKRAGKDTFAEVLLRVMREQGINAGTNTRGNARFALATPIRSMIEALNPVVAYMPKRRYQEVVADWGYEKAKDKFPDIRVMMQGMGDAVKTVDPDFFSRHLVSTMWKFFTDRGRIAFVTDLRFQAEEDYIRACAEVAGVPVVHIRVKESRHRGRPPVVCHHDSECWEPEVLDAKVNNDKTLGMEGLASKALPALKVIAQIVERFDYEEPPISVGKVETGL